METTFDKPIARRSLFFSLIIVVALILAAIALSFLIYLRMNALVHYEQEEFLLANRQAFLYDYDYDFTPENGRIPGWTCTEKPFVLFHLVKRFFYPDKIIYLQIHNLNDTDAANLLNELKSWQSVEHISFRNCSVDENTINALKMFKNLKVVGLKTSSIPENQLDQIKAEYPVVLEP